MESKIRNYRELKSLSTFEERLEYLRIFSKVGEATFGFDRVFNQKFYKSNEWKTIRNKVIVRDMGFDMGLDGYPINGKILIHHMNPIDLEDINNYTDFLTNPDYLVCVSHNTHNAIHYGYDNYEKNFSFPIRTKNDTCPWRNK